MAHKCRNRWANKFNHPKCHRTVTTTMIVTTNDFEKKNRTKRNEIYVKQTGNNASEHYCCQIRNRYSYIFPAWWREKKRCELFSRRANATSHQNSRNRCPKWSSSNERANKVENSIIRLALIATKLITLLVRLCAVVCTISLKCCSPRTICLPKYLLAYAIKCEWKRGNSLISKQSSW